MLLNIFLALLIEQLETDRKQGEREVEGHQHWALNLGPPQGGQSLCTWDAALPTELNAVLSISPQLLLKSQHLLKKSGDTVVTGSVVG